MTSMLFNSVEISTMNSKMMLDTETYNYSTTNTSDRRTQENVIEQTAPYMFAAIKLSAYLVPIVFSIIFILGMIGNSLVITVMTKMYKNKAQGLNSTNRFILNLAVSDLFFLIFCVPFQGVIYSSNSWPFGNFMCIFSEYCQKVAMLASVYTLVALSIDRYFAVVHATSAKQWRTKKNSIRTLVVVWVLAVGLAIPAAVTRQEIHYEGIALCIPNLAMEDAYVIHVVSIFVFGYVIPLGIIFACYLKLVLAMLQNAKTSAVSSNKSSQKSRKRVTKIVISVVILFMLDWFLHHMTTMWIQFGTFNFTEGTFLLKMLAHCLSYANSCVNPIIYAFMSNKFRNDFKKAISCQYINSALGGMKEYSSRFFSSLRKRKRRRLSGAKENIERDGAVPTKTLLPRNPTISLKPSSLSAAGYQQVTLDMSSSTCLFEIPKENGNRPTEKTASQHSKSPPSYNHCVQADVIHHSKQSVEVLMNNSSHLSQIYDSSRNNEFSRNSTHQPQSNQLYVKNFDEKVHHFIIEDSNDIIIEAPRSHTSGSKIINPKRKRVNSLGDYTDLEDSFDIF